MDWRTYQRTTWIGPKDTQLNLKYKLAELSDNSHGVFFILAHYSKKYEIKSYSVWYQDSILLKGGDNFALKIRKCSSFEEGQRIAENYYNDFICGANPKAIGTQYIDNDTFIDGPFST